VTYTIDSKNMLELDQINPENIRKINIYSDNEINLAMFTNLEKLNIGMLKI